MKGKKWGKRMMDDVVGEIAILSTLQLHNIFMKTMSIVGFCYYLYFIILFSDTVEVPVWVENILLIRNQPFNVKT